MIQSIRNQDLDQYISLCTIRLARDHHVVETTQCPQKSHVFVNQSQWDAEITEANTTIFAEKDNNYCFIIQNFGKLFFTQRYRGVDQPCEVAVAEIDEFLQFYSEVKARI